MAARLPRARQLGGNAAAAAEINRAERWRQILTDKWTRYGSWKTGAFFRPIDPADCRHDRQSNTLARVPVAAISWPAWATGTGSRVGRVAQTPVGLRAVADHRRHKGH